MELVKTNISMIGDYLLANFQGESIAAPKLYEFAKSSGLDKTRIINYLSKMDGNGFLTHDGLEEFAVKDSLNRNNKQNYTRYKLSEPESSSYDAYMLNKRKKIMDVRVVRGTITYPQAGHLVHMIGH